MARQRRRRTQQQHGPPPSGKTFFQAIGDWLKLVMNGADPIEALHGHVCGPTCWHEQMQQQGRR
jgi:hypothetical protein